MADELKDFGTQDVQQALRSLSRRIALLHLCYSRAAVKLLGKEKGIEIINEAIREYGTEIGKAMRVEAIKRGLEPNLDSYPVVADLPGQLFDESFSILDGKPRNYTYRCALAELWQDYGEEELGKFYCKVDSYKMETFKPGLTVIHERSLLDDEGVCELVVLEKTDDE